MYGGSIHPNLMKLKVISKFTAVRGADCDNNKQYRQHLHVWHYR
jgi:hypothetical protein